MALHGTTIIGFIIFFLVLFLVDLYVFKGVKTIFSTSSFPVRRNAAWLYWLVNAIFIVCAIYAMFSFSNRSVRPSFIFQFVIAAFVLLYIPKLIFGVFLLIEDIYRLVRALGVGIYKFTASSAVPVEFFESRRKFENCPRPER